MIKTWNIGPLVIAYDRYSEHEATFRVLQITWMTRA